MKTIQTYEEDQDMSALGRLHFWSVAFIMAKANPLWGVGYNGYNLSYNDYDFSHGEYNSRRAERAEKGRSVHSSFLAVLAELGFVGAALYGLIIIVLSEAATGYANSRLGTWLSPT
jgi:O-antigen ligase